MSEPLHEMWGLTPEKPPKPMFKYGSIELPEDFRCACGKKQTCEYPCLYVYKRRES